MHRVASSPFGQLLARGQVEVGEEDLALAQQRQFRRLRLLHLDDDLRLLENRGGVDRPVRTRPARTPPC